MKGNILKIAYIVTIVILFIIACWTGYMCITYDRFPEGMVIIGSAFVILIISLILFLTQNRADDKMVLAQAGPLLSKIAGVISFIHEDDVEVEEEGTIYFHKYGFIVDSPHIEYDLIDYDTIDDIYKEDDLDLFICVGEDTYKAVGSSKIKFMAAEDILNKQTNYRFNDAEDE